jgi:hypothetical protein
MGPHCFHQFSKQKNRVASNIRYAPNTSRISYGLKCALFPEKNWNLILFALMFISNERQFATMFDGLATHTAVAIFKLVCIRAFSI